MHELNRRMISAMIHDVLGETTRRITASGVQGADDVRDAAEALVGFSPDMAVSEAALKRFLFERMPEDWRRRFHAVEEPTARAYCVADYVAGMTDRYAGAEHNRLFGKGADPNPRQA